MLNIRQEWTVDKRSSKMSTCANFSNDVPPFFLHGLIDTGLQKEHNEGVIVKFHQILPSDATKTGVSVALMWSLSRRKYNYQRCSGSAKTRIPWELK